jgi:hypothetical protein
VRGIQDGSHAGQQGAAEECRSLERDVSADDDCRTAVDNRQLGEGTHAEVVVDGRAVVAQAAPAA